MKNPFRRTRQEEPVARLSSPVGSALPKRFDEVAASLRSDTSGAPARRGRSYYAAASGASYLSWDVQNVSADTALYFNLNRIKARARDLARNNDYARQFLRLLEANVVGPNGFTLLARRYQGKKLDRDFNVQLEGHWKAAAKLRNCPTVCGRMTRRELANLWIRTLATDGEVFEVFYPGHKNRYRFASRIVDATLVDWTKNETLPNGNRIKMGVEVDENDAPVAYWVLTRHPSEILFADTTRETHQRISATRARLTFLQETPGQTRGVSWLASPAIRAQMLQKFEEAVIMASRVAASKGGFYKTTPEYDGEVPGEEEGDDMLRRTLEPGEWEMLPPNVEPVAYDPKFPPSNIDTMTQAMLRGLASGLGGSYVAISNNLEGVNYSSIRAGDIEQRGIYRMLQAIVIDHHEEPYFTSWASILRLNPETPIDGRKLDSCIDNDEFKFLGRGWDWVDPLKEVQASSAAIALGVTTRGRVIAERTGEDVEDIFDQLALEKEMMEERGLDPRIGVVVQTSDTPDAKGKKKAATPDPDDEEDDE
ncbi:MAG: putative phage portal protein [Akkermansiaceae bacterium]|nr:putative phage portal protein [Akkermansiaceae bacterium]